MPRVLFMANEVGGKQKTQLLGEKGKTNSGEMILQDGKCHCRLGEIIF